MQLYLYRHMIEALATAGYRVLAPDFIGFGRSDKPGRLVDHSYQRNVDWAMAWLVSLDLGNVALFCQDRGALIGLRLVAQAPARFARVYVANDVLPTGDEGAPWLFRLWRAFSRYPPCFRSGRSCKWARAAG